MKGVVYPSTKYLLTSGYGNMRPARLLLQQTYSITASRDHEYGHLHRLEKEKKRARDRDGERNRERTQTTSKYATYS